MVLEGRPRRGARCRCVAGLGGSASAPRSSPPRMRRTRSSVSTGESPAEWAPARSRSNPAPAVSPHVAHSTPPSSRSNAGNGSSLVAAAGAGVEHRVEALERQQLPEERRAHERAWAASAQRAQRAHEHPVERRVGLPLLGDLVGGLEHRDRVGEAAVVLAQRAVGVDRLHLGDDVEVAAAPVALERHVAGGLEPGAEPAARLAHPLGHRPHLARALGEDGDDPVGLAELDASGAPPPGPGTSS